MRTNQVHIVKAIEFKGRTTFALSFGFNAKAGGKLKLNLGGAHTKTVDRPFYQRVETVSEDNNAYKLQDFPDLQDIVNQIVDTTNDKFETSNTGKELFKTMYFI